MTSTNNNNNNNQEILYYEHPQFKPRVFAPTPEGQGKKIEFFIIVTAFSTLLNYQLINVLPEILNHEYSTTNSIILIAMMLFCLYPMFFKYLDIYTKFIQNIIFWKRLRNYNYDIYLKEKPIELLMEFIKQDKNITPMTKKFVKGHIILRLAFEEMQLQADKIKQHVNPYVNE